MLRANGQDRRIVEHIRLSKDDTNKQKTVTRENSEIEIVNLLKRNRERELPGMFNPLIVSETFHQQAQPWERIAVDHIAKVPEAAAMFLNFLLAYLTDSNTASNLFAEVMLSLLEDHKTTMRRQLDMFLAPHQNGFPITYNHYFTETIQNIRQERYRKDLEERSRRFSPSLFDKWNNRKNQPYFDVQGFIAAQTTSNVPEMNRYAASEVLIPSPRLLVFQQEGQ